MPNLGRDLVLGRVLGAGRNDRGRERGERTPPIANLPVEVTMSR
jgi:hypothetical protein